MSGRVRTRVDKVSGERIAYSEMAIRNNSAIIEYCRTSMAALSGATSGILGLTSLYGFIFFFLAGFVLWLLLLIKAGNQWQQFFVCRKTLLTSGLTSGLFTYVLFWTFLYGMVHVY
ncbi:Rab5-interacting protein family [Trinorchestia longiramus]|nr:Rab5-interacting protein family [Trinorchestia longiramus]